MVNPFNAVPRSEYSNLATWFLLLVGLLEDAGGEIKALRAEVAREVRNGENLTALAARAIVSAEILKEALIERQIGKRNQGDLGRVLVANLPGKKETKSRYVPLHKRRRDAERNQRDEAIRRNALPKLLADLPPLPLTDDDCELMKEAVDVVKDGLSVGRLEY